MWQRLIFGALVLRFFAYNWFTADVQAWSLIPPSKSPMSLTEAGFSYRHNGRLITSLSMSKGASGGGDPDLDDDTTKRQGVNKLLSVDIIKGKPKDASQSKRENDNKSSDSGIFNKIFGNNKKGEVVDRSKETLQTESNSSGKGGFFNKFFDNDNKKDAKKDVKKDNKERSQNRVEKASENGFFRIITSRLSGRKDDDETETQRKESERLKIMSLKKDPTYFNPAKITGEALGSVEKTVLNFRKNLENVRAGDFFIEDPGGFMLSLEEEQARIKEVRDQTEAKRKKDKEEQANRSRQAELQARADDERRREAQVRASRRKVELPNSTKTRKEEVERQRRVLEASNKARSEIPDTLVRASVAQKSEEPITNEKRKQINPQGFPQNFFTKAEPENTTAVNDTSSFSFPNPLGAVGAAQRLVSSVWNSTFGGEKRVEEEWVVVFPKTRLDPGEVVPVNIGGIDLLVAASVDGKKLYSIANSCPHLGTPLETGPMIRQPVESGTNSDDGFEDCIVCPLHRTTFSMETGDVRGEWCPYPPVIGAVMGAVKKKSPVAVFDVRTRGKNVEVRINSSLEEMEKKRNTGSDLTKAD
jgi:nitrite reductase/ring-hydroxylating ferredoxin subunit